MGQTISKKMIPKNLSKAIDSFESQKARDALDDIARKQSHARSAGSKYYDPNAQDGGFKRDAWEVGTGQGMAQESRQREFLNEGVGGGGGVSGDVAGGGGAPQEMPKDLLDFLNAAGPLQRQVDKSRTSPRVYDSLLNDEEEERRMQKKANQRTRRRMLMVEKEQQQQPQPSQSEGGETTQQPVDRNEIESSEHMMSTTRTTNFSTGVAVIPDESELTLTDHDIVRLLQAVGRGELDPENYLRQRFTIGTVAATTVDDRGKPLDNGQQQQKQPVRPPMTEEEMQKNLIYLQNLIKYNAVPILMQDADDDVIGVYDHEVEDLKRQKMREVTNDARLVIQNEIEDGMLVVEGRKSVLPQIE